MVLFKRNIQSGDQLHGLILSLQATAKASGYTQPLLVALDQKNGAVARISPPITPQLPGMMSLGAAVKGLLSRSVTSNEDCEKNDRDEAAGRFRYRIGLATGKMLRCLGVNVNLSPVADVNSEPKNPVIGTRSVGDDPAFAADVVHTIVRGLRDGRVVPVIKHFPGHGDTAVDSHYGLPVVNKSREALEKCEFLSFERVVKSEGSVEMVMTAHVTLPGFNPNNIADKGLPASLSRDALDLLRKEWQYDGVIVTDCLEMNGVRTTYGTEEGAVMALKAGSDSIMICHTPSIQTTSIDRVCREVMDGKISIERVNESRRRLCRLKERYLSWEEVLSPFDGQALHEINVENEALSRIVYANSVTLVRSKPDFLLLQFEDRNNATVVILHPAGHIPESGVIDSAPPSKRTFTDVFKEKVPVQNVVDMPYTEDGLDASQWKRVEQATVVVYVTRNAKESTRYQHILGLEVARRNQRTVHVATGIPYDFLSREDEDGGVHTYVVTYEPSAEAFSVAIDILCHKASKGRLPVSLDKRTF